MRAVNYDLELEKLWMDSSRAGSNSIEGVKVRISNYTLPCARPQCGAQFCSKLIACIALIRERSDRSKRLAS